MLCLPRGNSSTTIHLLIHSSLIDYSWSSCLRKQVLVILVMITCMLQKLKCYHLCFCHLWPWVQLGLWKSFGFNMHTWALLCCNASVTFYSSVLVYLHMEYVLTAFTQQEKEICFYFLVNKKLNDYQWMI